MDIKDLTKFAGGIASFLANAVIGDIIHDRVEDFRDGKTKDKDAGDGKSAKTDKISPFLGLAILTKDDQYKFRRVFQNLDDETQASLAEFLLSYYVEPAKNGAVSWITSVVQYDRFMLDAVNGDSPSQKLGSTKTVTVDKVTRTRSETTTTTEQTREDYTQGGKESVTFLKELAYIYRIGGIKPAEEFLKLQKMPTMDATGLKKADDFIKTLPTQIWTRLNAFKDWSIESFNVASTDIEELSKKIDSDNKNLGWFRRLLNNI